MVLPLETNPETATGWLSAPERAFLSSVYTLVPAYSSILNIGVEFGASLVCLLNKNPTVTVYGIDLDISKCLAGGTNLRLIRGDSHLLGPTWRRPIQFLFIDGDHGREGVRQDILHYSPWVVQEGWMALHDCYSWEEPKGVHRICPGVNEAVTEWFSSPAGQLWAELPYISSLRIFRRIS